MRKLIILRGNSGSGKSSVSKSLQKHIGRNTLLIPQDTIRRELLWAHDGYNTTVLPLLITLLQYGYEHCEVVILEGIFNAKWYEPLFHTAVELYGKNIYAYYYDLSFEETLKRHETRDLRFNFGEEEMRRWWNEKDYLACIHETTIDESLSLEETVRMILNDVLAKNNL